MLTCAKISVLALSTCFTLAASFRNLAMARGDWVTSPCVLYFSYKDVEDKFQSVHTSTAQWGSNFWVCGWNPKVWPFKWKLLSSTFLWCGSVQGGPNWFLDEILKCDHSNESYCKLMRCNSQNLFVNVDFLLFYLRYLSMIKYLEDFDQMISQSDVHSMASKSAIKPATQIWNSL